MAAKLVKMPMVKGKIRRSLRFHGRLLLKKSGSGIRNIMRSEVTLKGDIQYHMV